MYIDPLGLSTMHWTPGGVGFPVSYQEMNLEATPGTSLKSKVIGTIIMRSGRGVAVPFNIYNRLRQDYTFNDDLGEMNEMYAADIRRFYEHVVKYNKEALKSACCKWMKLYFPPPTPGDTNHEWRGGNSDEAWIGGLGYILGRTSSSNVSATGTCKARYCNENYYMKNRKVNWELRDRVDGRSFKELGTDSVKSAEYWFEGIFLDLIHDKLLGASFDITIKWRDDNPSEMRFPVRSDERD
jgi:hypothetical protein